MDVKAGGSNKRKAPSASADKTGMRGRHGARQGHAGHDGGRRENLGAETLGVGGNNGGCEASRVEPESHGVGGGRGAARPPEWQKTLRGGTTEWAGKSSSLRVPTPPEWQGGPGETKTQEPPQRPNIDRGKTDGGGGEGTKTHPPPKQP